MRRILLRSLTVACVIAPMGAVGVLATPASAAGTVCSGNSGAVTFSPGLTTTAKAQNIVIKGSLTGCTGSTVTTAKYVAKLKSSAPETCSSLAVAGETATGSVVVKWSPKGQGNSNGALTFTTSEGGGGSFAGTFETGLFAGQSLSGALETFTPLFKSTVEPCSKKNPLKKATFTGSAVTIS
ncbi:MAG: hypothetical protein ACYDHN_17035 [Solirubrobacteraceae bacterium]